MSGDGSCSGLDELWQSDQIVAGHRQAGVIELLDELPLRPDRIGRRWQKGSQQSSTPTKSFFQRSLGGSRINSSRTWGSGSVPS
jgi:hypothetical protein